MVKYIYTNYFLCSLKELIQNFVISPQIYSRSDSEVQACQGFLKRNVFCHGNLDTNKK